MPSQNFTLTGLTCKGCVETVTDVATAMPGVRAVQIDLREGGESTLCIDGDRDVSTAQLQAALSLVGAFTVLS